MTKKLNKEQIEAIQNYSDEIQTLESFIEAVRLRPGMYIGRVGAPGFLNMVREIFQNSVDQVINPKSPADTIRFTYDENSQYVIVEDNGMGIPHKDMVRVFTSQHTGSNFKRQLGKFSSGLHGVGAKVTNALSSEFHVESYVLGKGMKLDFVDGINTTEKPVAIKDGDLQQGTRISFKPATSIMGDFHLPWKTIYDLIFTIVSLTDLGTTVYFKAITRDGKTISEKIVNEDGIMANLVTNTEKPLVVPIYMKHESPEMKMEVAFTYDVKDETGSQDLIAYSNFCPTTAGTHIDGFEEGLGIFFRKYMNDIYLPKNSKYKVNIQDIRAGLRGILNVAHIEPTFDGQSKEILTNEDMRGYMRETTATLLETWSQEKPNDLKKVAGYLKDMAELRYKSEHGREKLSTKYTKSVVTGLYDKFEKPTGDKNLEFIMVEGESAAGSAKNARCAKRQGIMQLKGKIISSFSNSQKDVLANNEVGAIINILDAGYGKNCDVSKSKYEKIIMLTDADVDGKHIEVLILELFLTYLRPFVEAGMLYKATPPLYGLKKGNKSTYFRDKLDYVEYCQKDFCKNHTIDYPTGSAKMSNNDIKQLLYSNMEYEYELNVLANTYSFNPVLVEMILSNLDKTDKQLEKMINDKFRFLKVSNENGVRMITGLANRQYQTIVLNDRFMKAASIVIRLMEKQSSMYYKLDDKIVSLYELLNIFNKFNSSSSITRFKGLGEMNADELRKTAIHPDFDRALVRCTVNSIDEDIKRVREIESNKKKLVDELQVSRYDIL